MMKAGHALAALIAPVAIAGIVFTSAGRMDLPFVWAVVGVVMAFHVALVAFADPGMVQERVAPGAGNQDRLTRPLSSLLLLVHWVVAGLDVGRFHWSLVPTSIQGAGLACFVSALGVNFWAMWTNRFYSSVVRVQPERGHRPIVGGPYRFVRHPGYAATIVAMVGGGVAFGSWFGVIPVLGVVAAFIRRTQLEDRMLEADLPGYAEYARVVRWRLLPGVF